MGREAAKRWCRIVRYSLSMLAPAPRERFVAPWDMKMTSEEFERIVRDRTAAARDLWNDVERYLGMKCEFRAWLLDEWETGGYVRR